MMIVSSFLLTDKHLPYFLCTDVKISFSEKNYEAVESSGSVELCAKITERCLGTDVDVKISIMSDTG